MKSVGIMTSLIYHVRKDRPDLADDFLEGLKKSKNLQARDPILTARTKIVGQRTANTGQRPVFPARTS